MTIMRSIGLIVLLCNNILFSQQHSNIVFGQLTIPCVPMLVQITNVSKLQNDSLFLIQGTISDSLSFRGTVDASEIDSVFKVGNLSLSDTLSISMIGYVRKLIPVNKIILTKSKLY